MNKFIKQIIIVFFIINIIFFISIAFITWDIKVLGKIPYIENKYRFFILFIEIMVMIIIPLAIMNINKQKRKEL